MNEQGPGTAVAFLDRDGTLIEDVGYGRDPEQVRLLPNAAGALRALRRAGFGLVVVGNQSGIGRGIISPSEASAVHARFLSELAREGISLDAVEYCPHAPWAGCECRKPSPALLHKAATELGVSLEASFMVGDKASDVEAGRRAGCRTILLAAGGVSSVDADHVASDWTDALRYLLDPEAACTT